jgi:hypothetical protein
MMTLLDLFLIPVMVGIVLIITGCHNQWGWLIDIGVTILFLTSLNLIASGIAIDEP